jgi:type I restriction-modification system DNA methylase subunit
MNREQLKKLERDLWSAADKLRANSDLKASEYSTPVLGLIFLKFADNKYRQHEDAIVQEYTKRKGTRTERGLDEIAIDKCGFFLKDFARYDYLLKLPEKEDIAKAKHLLKRLVDEQPKVLVQDWFKTSQTQERVRGEIARVVNDDLPESYDRAVFKQKCDNVYNLMVEYAMRGKKWAA